MDNYLVSIKKEGNISKSQQNNTNGGNVTVLLNCTANHIKRAHARNPRVMIPSHNRGDKYLHEIHF
jgi:hypothetical protein